MRVAVYASLRRLGLPKLLLLGALAVVALVLTGGARAATYSAPCTIDVPLCERLEVLVAELEQKPETDSEYDYAAILASIEANTAGSGEPAEVAGTVALSARDREALDLNWYGIWAVVGLLLVLMIAPQLMSVMRVTRGMADGRG